jgi:hypothetical protein
MKKTKEFNQTHGFFTTRKQGASGDWNISRIPEKIAGMRE